MMLEESHRLSDGPIRMSSTLMRKIRQSLLFIADGTAIGTVPGALRDRLNTTPAQLIPSPNVCVELGYALQCKRSEQILLTQMERSEFGGQFPFDLPGRNRIVYGSKTDLHKSLPDAIDLQLQRFNLL
ncbi:MAG: hypothetical protein HC895_16740 [Leptolyngbyaceae cyanobacterium SM1_3_5]|nr:hypothetical protein [Leptolyngbyaceae cyanobacterium SM1_3_5]